jgi:hypothetical protein
MDPDSMRCCMSFGFSDKQSGSSIGQCMCQCATKLVSYILYHVPQSTFCLIWCFAIRQMATDSRLAQCGLEQMLLSSVAA